MKHHPLLLAAAALLLFSPIAATARPAPKLGVVGMARYHQTHTAVREWPFDKDDMSYGAGLLLYDGMGYLELGCEYAPDSSFDAIDEVVTPYARLVIEDMCVAAGFANSST